ncbi:MAG TPA: GH1 family beta-glucosidase [Flavobacterium sp.]|jgi:beta-glucosidase
MDPIENILSRRSFGDDFNWGVSTAAFQIEGAHEADGKGLSIWDVFAARKGKIKNGDHAQSACNFYNTYKTDIALLQQLKIPNFRFSISWPRLMPYGRIYNNPAGIDYYDRLVDHLLECGINPWVTLYHWDLPQDLEAKGGWTNRDIVSWFSDYAALCANKFGDRVKDWMVMNEPSVFTGAGYFLGIHAPGRRGLSNYLSAIHHATMSTSAAANIMRDNVPNANIGTTFSFTDIEPFSSKEKDIAAAKRVDTLLNRTFLEPILGMGYPKQDLPVLRKMEKYIVPGDEDKLAFDFDYIGIQCYTREIVKASRIVPYIGATLIKAADRNVETTEMGWEVYPPSIYNLIHKINKYNGVRKIIITENGAAFPDTVCFGRVIDTSRIQYLQDHLQQVLKAKNEGCRVDGYFVWSLTDNFEWAEGYHARFGLIYVDFETQERIIKQSGHWYKEFLTK